LRGRLHAVHAGAPATAGGAAGPAALDRVLRTPDIAPGCRHLIAGDPTAVVRDAARQLRADIVVAGAVSRSGLKRAFIGNTAERLLDCLPCDLLIVKPAEFSSGVACTVRGARLVAGEPLG
ncbi:MAG TPA: universal stress protein, partial [Candidatus Dormibacteraeota bacterium]|nr:universal stress protein [Candidatus Dormibacteraeota bacterium]